MCVVYYKPPLISNILIIMYSHKHMFQHFYHRLPLIAHRSLIGLGLIGLISFGVGCGEPDNDDSATTPLTSAVSNSRNNTASSNTTTTNSTTSNTNTNTSSKAAGFTLEDVAGHASATDCWMAIDGQVYNVTDYITQHPGGAQIIQGCGVDASELFATQGGRGQHSGAAQDQLQQFLIGKLVE